MLKSVTFQFKPKYRSNKSIKKKYRDKQVQLTNNYQLNKLLTRFNEIYPNTEIVEYKLSYSQLHIYYKELG